MEADAMIIGLQLVAILFSFSMIYFAVLAKKRDELSVTEGAIWFAMWGVAIVVIIFPELLRKFSLTFFVTRVFDLMVIFGFILVITLIGSAYLRTKRLEKKIEELVRRDALKKGK